MNKYINEDEALDLIHEHNDELYAPDDEDITTYLLENMPSADVRENIYGEWRKGKEISRTMLAGGILYIDYENFKCSNCGIVLKELLYHTDGSPFYKFCPNCGADMIERRTK